MQTRPNKVPGFFGVISAAGTLACLASAISLLAKWWWWADLATHFRLQYTLFLALTAVVSIIYKKRIWLMVFAAFALGNGIYVAVLYSGGDQITGTTDLRLLSANVNLRSGRVQDLKTLIKHEDPDVILLMEVDRAWLNALLHLAESHPFSLMEPRNDNFGMAVFSKHPMTSKQVLTLSDSAVPVMNLRLKVGHQHIRLIAVHPLPPVSRHYALDRDQLIHALIPLTTQDSSTIVMGDFNATPWSAPMNKLIRATSLLDPCDYSGFVPTWPTTLWPLMIPIDHCLHSTDLKLIQKITGMGIGSDHLPIILDFQIPGP